MDDFERIDKIKSEWNFNGLLSDKDVQFLVDYAVKFQGERDPQERKADYAELKQRLYEVARIDPDVPMSYFSLVDAIEGRLRGGRSG